MVEYFSDIVDYQFTARTEVMTRMISNGCGGVDGSDEFPSSIRGGLEKAQAGNARHEERARENRRSCPDDGANWSSVADGQKFISCANFPIAAIRNPGWRRSTLPGRDGGELVEKKTQGTDLSLVRNYPNCGISHPGSAHQTALP